jgi:hypothetical protein
MTCGSKGCAAFVNGLAAIVFALGSVGCGNGSAKTQASHAGSGASASASTGGRSGSSGTSAATGGTAARSGGSGSSAAGSGTAGRGGSAGSGSGGSMAGMSMGATAIAAKLGHPHFLIGMGNDLDNNHDNDGVYTLGVTLDLHDAYMVGLMGRGGWPDWNANGSFVDILAKPAKDRGVVPMYTLYAMASGTSEGDPAVLTDDSYMKPYWDGAKLLYQRIAMIDTPTIVHLEPDWWAFAQQKAKSDPSTLPAHVTSLAPDCAGQPDNLIGMGKCLVALGRKYAPKAVIGFHASVWADSDPAKIGAFLVKVGAGDADIIVVDVLDRDAGCFEAHGPECTRNDGPWYWDETNKTSPSFHEHLAWAKAIGQGVGKPVLWWQVPFGVPSATPGGTPSHYRDNRVKYIFEHIDEFIAAGGLGVEFGVGASNQTYITTDGDQFKNAVTKYFASPMALP